MSNDIEKLTRTKESASDSQIAKLEDDLQGEKDGRKVERFIFALLGIILFDAAVLIHTPWHATFVIFVFELILLIVLARVCGIDDIYTIIQNAIDSAKSVKDFKPASKSAAEEKKAVTPPASANSPSIDGTPGELAPRPPPSDTAPR